MSRRPFAVAALAALFAATTAVAQPSSAQTPTTQSSTMQRLHDALRLAPGQQPAWGAFERAAGADPQIAAQQRAAEAMMPRLNAPQRVDLSIAALRAQLESLERRGAALKTFYADLTPEQKAIFDRETAPSE